MNKLFESDAIHKPIDQLMERNEDPLTENTIPLVSNKMSVLTSAKPAGLPKTTTATIWGITVLLIVLSLEILVPESEIEDMSLVAKKAESFYPAPMENDEILFSHSSSSSSSSSSSNTTTQTKSEIDNLYIMIISSRGGFFARNAIRKTWAKNLKGRYKFLVGQHYCQLREDLREIVPKCRNCNCDPSPKLPKDTQLHYVKNPEDEALYDRLKEEQEEFGDTLLLDMIDTYQNLTLKMKLGFKTIVELSEAGEISPKPKWVMKCDDDAVILGKEIEEFVTEKYNDVPNLYVGRMYTHRKVIRHGLWAELNFANPKFATEGPVLGPLTTEEKKKYENELSSNEFYPQYASGASGYILSFSLAKYIHDEFDNLFNYICEDTSIGIWLKQAADAEKFSNNPVLYVSDHERFKFDGYQFCRYLGGKFLLTLGHRMTGTQLGNCYKYYLTGARGSQASTSQRRRRKRRVDDRYHSQKFTEESSDLDYFDIAIV